jgi:hypothetical protein
MIRWVVPKGKIRREDCPAWYRNMQAYTDILIWKREYIENNNNLVCIKHNMGFGNFCYLGVGLGIEEYFDNLENEGQVI